VQILVDDQVVAIARVGNNGAWSANVPLGDPGQYLVSVRTMANGVVGNAVATPLSVSVPMPLPTATATSAPVALELRSPNDGESGTGERLFEWVTTYTPAEGEGFELVFWPPEGNAMANGFGLAAPTNDTRLNLDLSKLDDTLGTTFEPGPYNWGILLVRREPYERLRLLSAPRTFIYYRASDNDSSGGTSGGGGGQNSGEGEGSQSSGEP
jgi:hypothetical protein